MRFKVIHDFTDLQDSSFVYLVGDNYPRKGAKPSEERISELLGESNKIGTPLIEKIPEEKKAEKQKPSTVKTED